MSTLFPEPITERALEFRILGQLEVVAGNDVLPIGPFKQRALLALLVINANQVISTDRILDELWGEEAAGKQNALWVHVSQLRNALEPGRAPRAESSVLLSRSPGYVLPAEPGQIDAGRFETMLAEGRSLLEADPQAASLVLGEALALWRGKPLEDFTYEEFAQREIARLEELRIEAVEERIEADLATGRGRELVGELEALVREHPLREQLTGLLMRALYRSGRQAAALRAYRQLAARLGESLGIEPGPSLRRLEEEIVLQEASLTPGPLVGTGPAPGLAIRGYELREEIGRGSYGVAFRTFQPAVGREVAIKVIRPELANDADFIRRFEAEAGRVARLEHPHIVPLYDYWREPDAAYLVMRLMKGGSLADHLHRGPIAPDRAGEIIGRVAEALAAAHRRGIVHRDVKPSNILLDQDGGAYLSDFGITGAVGTGGTDPEEQRMAVDRAYASPEQLENAPLSVRSDVFSLGVVLREVLTGSPDARPGDLSASSALLEVADQAAAASPEERYPDVETFASDLVRAAGHGAAVIAPAVPVENPYKGLRPFGESDAGTFFGRERLVERLLTRLGTRGSEGRFVALVGPSGSGKSSAVKAGLLPSVRAGAVHDSQNWFVAEMVPGAHPFEELETALLRVAVNPPPTLLEQLRSGARGLHRAVGRILPDDHSQLLLVVDQLEEIFTQTRSEEVRKPFLDALRVATTANPGRLRVVVTLRADFYDRPLRYHDFGELLRGGTEVITPMSPEELERAVAGPAEAVGAALEPGLSAAVVSDVADEPSALPLLQYAMTELFERREGGTLTAESYRELEGVAGALGRRAEALFRELEAASADAARQVFLRLVSLGEGGEDTRRRVLRSELRAIGERPDAVDEVLEVYGGYRLLTYDRDPVSRGPTVELAHEALLREWPRYREWVDGARSDLRRQRRLAGSAAEWRQNEDHPDYLLTGSRLGEAEAWLAETDLELTDLERRYVVESSQHAGAAEATRRRRRNLVIGTVAGAAALALSLLVFGLTQRSAADRLEAVERVNRVIEAAENALDFDPELSLLLAVAAAEDTESLGLDVFPENLEVLHDGLRAQRLLFSLEDAASAVFSPDGSRVYVGLLGRSISIRDATTGAELDTIPAPSSPSVAGSVAPEVPIAVSRDGRWITNGYALVDTRERETEELTWPGQRHAVIDVAFDPGGVRFAAAHYERGHERPGAGTLAVWDLATQEEMWSRRDLSAPVQVDFSPEGALLAVANSTVGQPPSVNLYEAATGKLVDIIETPGQVVGVAFHPAGNRLLIGLVGGVGEWDLEIRAFTGFHGGHDGPVNAIDVADAGAVMVSGDAAGVVIVRDGETGEPRYSLFGHGGQVVQAGLSSDGTRLALVTADILEPGFLQVFDTSVEGGRDLATIAIPAIQPATVDVDPGGSLIAVGDHDAGTRRVWTMAGERLLDLPLHSTLRTVGVAVNGPVAFSPDGSRIATGDAAGLIRLWATADGSLLASSDVPAMAPDVRDVLGSSVLTVTFSPDGRQLAIGGVGFVLVADAATLDDSRVLASSPFTFTESLAFSPNGNRLIAGRSRPAPGTEDRLLPVSVWDVSTGEEIHGLSLREDVPAVDYSPSGDLVAVATGVVTVLDAETFDVRTRLATGTTDIWDVAFSPDGELLAVAYLDGVIAIWDPYRGDLLYSLSGHDDVAADLDWTDDGTRLVSVGLDATIRIYVMDTVELLDLAQARVTRDLGADECRQYLGGDRC